MASGAICIDTDSEGDELDMALDQIVARAAVAGADPVIPQPQPLLDDAALRRVEARSSRLALMSRFHRAPRRLEEDYEVNATVVLGTGCSGKVVLGNSRHSGRRVAIKTLRERSSPLGVNHSTDMAANNRTAEAEIFLSLDHPHIVQLVDVYEGFDGRLSLVMECMDGGELFDRVIKVKQFKEDAAAIAARQMLVAIAYLHGIGVAHRDIKLENYMYSSRDSDVLKLIDFGFSVFCKDFPDERMTSACGTLSYAAPEVLMRDYTSQCDLWSLGVVMFIVMGGYMPFEGPHPTQAQRIRSGSFVMREDRWAQFSGLSMDFVQQLLVLDPGRRLTAKEALRHPWLVGQGQRSSASHVSKPIVDNLREFAQASKLLRSCFVLSVHLTGRESGGARDAFLELDTEHRGTVRFSDLKLVLVSKFGVPTNEANEIVSALDMAGIGEVRYSDFLAASMPRSACGDGSCPDDMIQEAFRRLGPTGEFGLAALMQASTSCESFTKKLHITKGSTSKGRRARGRACAASVLPAIGRASKARALANCLAQRSIKRMTIAVATRRRKNLRALVVV
eukprot:TRINITY_DN28810_c0_g1_i1.p1 TRINITY_DN28810_c0_g1~~TRINITY_DN28810_c0_g1_i1.p1  ORF type:complete len:578 (+),score=98.12 TRINITY_DN28810_c0_g1_i1:47-1735(+)